MWYEGGSVSSATRRLLFADRIGSIIAVANAAGGVLGTNTYDEYGLNGPTSGYDNSGRFR